jgi:hypothetical protein
MVCFLQFSRQIEAARQKQLVQARKVLVGCAAPEKITRHASSHLQEEERRLKEAEKKEERRLKEEAKKEERRLKEVEKKHELEDKQMRAQVAIMLKPHQRPIFDSHVAVWPSPQEEESSKKAKVQQQQSKFALFFKVSL